jgi:protein XagA
LLALSLIISCVFLLSSLSQPAYAGAWTQAKGDGLLIENYSYYYTSRFINNVGKRQSQPTYQKFEYNPYVEYGLADGVTIGANLFLQYIRQNTTQSITIPTGPFSSVTTTYKGVNQNIGIGDSEFFVRKRLWQKDGFIVSAEPMVKAPALISYDEFPDVGNSRPDIGLTLSGGYSFKAYGQYHFANLDTGYRYRFGKQKDQIRIAATLGITLDNQWMVMPQLFITRRTSSPNVGPTFNENPANDYNLTKVQLSTIYKMWDDTALQLGGFYHVDARNSSLGGGVLIALWDFF